jgi:hypothetical protein
MAQKKTAKKAKPAARSAKPAARTTHKKAVARKAVRKTPVKHVAKATKAPSAKGGDFTKYSGKFTVRLPKSLHQALVERAEREGVSLNLFVTNALSRTVASPGGRGKK